MSGRRGMTLIETLVATVVLAIMAGAVLMVTAHISRATAASANTSSRPPEESVLDIVRRDLQSCLAMELSADGQRLRLSGHIALEESDWRPTARYADVDYAIESPRRSGPSILLRRQRGGSNRRIAVASEIVAWNVKSISLSARPHSFDTVEAARADAVRVVINMADGAERAVDVLEKASVP